MTKHNDRAASTQGSCQLSSNANLGFRGRSLRMFPLFAVISLVGCAGPVDSVDEDMDEDVGTAADAVTGNACTTPSANDTAALNKINQIRTSLGNGMGAVNCDNKIRTAAQKHGLYQGTNNIMTHTEDPTKPNYYATNFWERMTKAGYTGSAKSEVISSYGNPTSAINQWMDSALHRAPFMDYTVGTFGFGFGTVSGTAKFGTLDFGGGGVVPSQGSYAIWPVNNATGIRRGFDCNTETPKPCSSSTAGYPIMFSTSDALVVTHHTLKVNATGAVVGHLFLKKETDSSKPGYYLGKNQVVMIPNSTLAANTKYRVELGGTLAPDYVFLHTYYFTTGSSI
ncbi:MAG: CAP domain-containing protein [Polyangiaceae bacterium]|nr:CAP domain-containing protein [Polyangiaceae bacterium]